MRAFCIAVFSVVADAVLLAQTVAQPSPSTNLPVQRVVLI
jgi:hypothetical protein